MVITLTARPIIVAVAVLIAAAVTYMYVTPVYLVRIELRPSQSIGVQFTCNDHMVEPDGNGVAFMDICAQFAADSPASARFEVKSSKTPNWFPHDFSVTSNGFLIGVVPLGDSTYPLRQDEDYLYRLTEPDTNRLLSSGEIRASVRTIAGRDRTVVALLGMSASVLQILSVLFLPFGDSRTREVANDRH